MKRSPIILTLITLYFAVLPLNKTMAASQVIRTEIVPISTVTLTDREFLTGSKSGKPTIIAGTLRIPRLNAGRLPAVILVHSSAGVGAEIDSWSQELNSMGIATFTIDGFTGRGIDNTLNDQEQLGRLTMIVDAYRALAWMASNPRIDPKRIVLLGTSRGGQIALYASVKRFQRMYAPPGVQFAAYLSFYGSCNTTYIDDADVTSEPIRLFHGALDDYVPVAPCRAYVERLRSRGADVQLTEYPDAYHEFDNPLLPTTPLLLPQAQTIRSCNLAEKPIGQIISADTQRAFTYADPCVVRGSHVAYNALAHNAAIQAVRNFLQSIFKLN